MTNPTNTGLHNALSILTSINAGHELSKFVTSYILRTEHLANADRPDPLPRKTVSIRKGRKWLQVVVSDANQAVDRGRRLFVIGFKGNAEGLVQETSGSKSALYGWVGESRDEGFQSKVDGIPTHQGARDWSVQYFTNGFEAV